MLLMVVMFTKGTTVAIFAIVMALMLITASSYASSASAEKVGHKGKKSSIDHASTQGQQSIPTQGQQSIPTQGHQSTSPLDQTLQSTPTQGQPTSPLEHQTGFPFK
jgi:hypothetical protein